MNGLRFLDEGVVSWDEKLAGDEMKENKRE